MIDLNISDDLKQVAQQFKDELNNKQILAVLANSINASLTQYKKKFNKETKTKYNTTPKLMNTYYFARRANASKGDKVEGSLGYRSKPTPLSEFVQNTEGRPAVYIKSPKPVKGAFFVKDFGLNVFKHGKKVAPSKGKYAGKIASKGENKGKLIQRQQLDKRYTLTVPQFANQVAPIVMADPLLLKIFEEKLTIKLNKIKASK